MLPSIWPDDDPYYCVNCGWRPSWIWWVEQPEFRQRWAAPSSRGAAAPHGAGLEALWTQPAGNGKGRRRG